MAKAKPCKRLISVSLKEKSFLIGSISKLRIILSANENVYAMTRTITAYHAAKELGQGSVLFCVMIIFSIVYNNICISNTNYMHNLARLVFDCII